jgi:hypothetical protein
MARGRFVLGGVVMETHLSKSDWIHRFGRTLMRLRPSMNAVTAAEHAVDAYPESSEVAPEDAAKRWVDDRSPDDCAA